MIIMMIIMIVQHRTGDGAMIQCKKGRGIQSGKIQADMK